MLIHASLLFLITFSQTTTKPFTFGQWC